MLAIAIRVFIVVVCLVFLIGMQFGFAPGPGRAAVRALLLASIAAAIGVAVYFGWAVPDPTPWLAAPGAVLAAAGCGLFVWCLLYHPRRPGKAFAADPPTAVVLGGPYRLARHPIYLSYLLALGGTALLAHSWAVAGLGVWMAVLYWYAARTEERLILTSPHAAGYAAYMRRAGPFWPRLAHAEGCLPKLRTRLSTARLLNLDDWGVAPLSHCDRHDLLEATDDRVPGGSVLITSQLPNQTWHDYLSGPLPKGWLQKGDAVLDITKLARPAK